MVAPSPKPKKSGGLLAAKDTLDQIAREREQVEALRRDAEERLKRLAEAEERARRRAVVEEQIEQVQVRIATLEAKLQALAARWNGLEYVGGYPPDAASLAADALLRRLASVPHLSATPPLAPAPATVPMPTPAASPAPATTAAAIPTAPPATSSVTPPPPSLPPAAPPPTPQPYIAPPPPPTPYQPYAAQLPTATSYATATVALDDDRPSWLRYQPVVPTPPPAPPAAPSTAMPAAPPSTDAASTMTDASRGAGDGAITAAADNDADDEDAEQIPAWLRRNEAPSSAATYGGGDFLSLEGGDYDYPPSPPQADYDPLPAAAPLPPPPPMLPAYSPSPANQYQPYAPLPAGGGGTVQAATLPPARPRFALPGLGGGQRRITTPPARGTGRGNTLIIQLIVLALIALAFVSYMVFSLWRESVQAEGGGAGQAEAAQAAALPPRPTATPMPTATLQPLSTATASRPGMLIPTYTPAPPPAPTSAPPVAEPSNPPPPTPTVVAAADAGSVAVEATPTRIPTGAEVADTAPPPPAPSPAEVKAIKIPAIGLDTAVAEVGVVPVTDAQGNQLKDANGNPRYRWGTMKSVPGLETPEVGCGDAGNITLNGHNWGNGVGVFADLDSVQIGDKLICIGADGQNYTYSFFIVGEAHGPQDTHITDLRAGEERTITLYTCNATGTRRVVFVARLQV